MGTLTLCTPLPQLEFAEIAGVNSPRVNSTDCMCQIVTTGTQVKAARNSPNQSAVRASGTCFGLLDVCTVMAEKPPGHGCKSMNAPVLVELQ